MVLLKLSMENIEDIFLYSGGTVVSLKRKQLTPAYEINYLAGFALTFRWSLPKH